MINWVKSAHRLTNLDNKSMSDKEIKEKIEQLDLLENNNWIPISAVSGKNIEQLKILIKQNLDSTRKITSNGNQK